MKVDRIIFVGLHNKPHMAPLDPGTKTGKLVNRIISKLPNDIQITKSNILDTDEVVPPNEMHEYAQSWYWTHLPTNDDIIILLGAMTHNIHRTHVRQVGRIIKVAHPASNRSHKAMDKYVDDVSEKINNLI